MQERDQIKQTHRYYSTTHNMKVVDPILTGKYLQSQTRAPPKELMEAMGMPVSPPCNLLLGGDWWLKNLHPHLSQLEASQLGRAGKVSRLRKMALSMRRWRRIIAGRDY